MLILLQSDTYKLYLSLISLERYLENLDASKNNIYTNLIS